MQKVILNFSHLAFGVMALICGLAVGFFLELHRDSSSKENSMVYAIVGDRTILGSEILPLVKEDLRQIERRKYLLKKKAVTELVSEKSPTTESEAQIGESSREGFADFLKMRNLNSKKMTKKQLEDASSNFKIFSKMQVRKNQKYEQAKKMKIEWRIPMTFLEESVVVNKGFLSPLINGSPARTLIVFANYHCPYCLEAFHKIDILREKYKDKVRLHFRFAMNEPENSVVFLSAVATACADEQGRLGDFFKNMFDAVPTDSSQLPAIAEKSRLNRSQFENCMSSDSARSKVRGDIRDSKKMGIDHSAVVFVNGHQIAIQEPFEYLEDVIIQD